MSKAPQFVSKVILHMFYGAINILWYPKYPCKKEYASCPATMFRTSFIKSNGYGSFFVATLSFLKSTQICFACEFEFCMRVGILKL